MWNVVYVVAVVGLGSALWGALAWKGRVRWVSFVLVLLMVGGIVALFFQRAR